MKRIAYTLSLVAATALAAAPLAAQSSGNGPWWDPGRTQTRSGQNGSVYGRNGSVYDQADGQWRADGRDRNGNTVYVRTRYDSNGQLVREWATRNIIGRYNIIDRQYLDNGNGRYGTNRDVYGNRGVYDSRGTYDRRAEEARIRRDEQLRREQIKRDEKYRKEQLKLEERRIKEQEKYRREEIKRQEKENRRNDSRGKDHGKKEGWWKH